MKPRSVSASVSVSANVLRSRASPDPEGILAEIITEEDLLARDRLPAYWEARNDFIRVGMDIEKTGDVVKLHETASKPESRVNAH